LNESNADKTQNTGGTEKRCGTQESSSEQHSGDGFFGSRNGGKTVSREFRRWISAVTGSSDENEEKTAHSKAELKKSTVVSSDKK